MASDGVIAGVKVVLFDVDDTLYSPADGLGNRIVSNIEQYFIQRMNVAPADATATRKRYQKTGTTLCGLVAEASADFDIDDYLSFVYESIDYSEYLKPNPSLRSMLEQIGKKRRVWAFSNAHKEHVLAVLKALDIPLTVFEGVIEARGLNFMHKPTRSAYDTAMLACGNCEPREALLIDDNFLNVEGARYYGMQAVHVSNSTDPCCPDEGCQEYQARTASPRNSRVAQSCVQDVMQLKLCYPDLFH